MSSPELSSSNSPRAPYRKPRADIYTVLLSLALVAILVGLTFLALELDLYNWDSKSAPSPPPIGVVAADSFQVDGAGPSIVAGTLNRTLF